MSSCPKVMYPNQKSIAKFSLQKNSFYIQQLPIDKSCPKCTAHKKNQCLQLFSVLNEQLGIRISNSSKKVSLWGASLKWSRQCSMNSVSVSNISSHIPQPKTLMSKWFWSPDVDDWSPKCWFSSALDLLHRLEERFSIFCIVDKYLSSGWLSSSIDVLVLLSNFLSNRLFLVFFKTIVSCDCLAVFIFLSSFRLLLQWAVFWKTPCFSGLQPLWVSNGF